MKSGNTTRSPAATTRVGPLAIFLLLITGTVYSLLFPVNKIAASHGVPPVAYVFWISLGGGAILLVACAARGKLPRLGLNNLRTYVVGGALGVSVPMTLLVYLAPKLPSGIITMIVVITPLLTYLCALPTRLERFRLLSVIGLLSALGGVLLLAVPGVSLPAPGMAYWVLLALVAPVCFAGFNVFIGLFGQAETGSLQLGTGVLLAGALLLLPVALGTGQIYVFPGAQTAGDLAILYGWLINTTRWWLVFEIIRMAGPVFLSQFAYVMVFAGFGWGALLFGDSVGVYIWAATALLILGLALDTLGRLREQRALDLV
jgi:drug/metabolite transporter (DMT)-like permease